MKIIDLDLQRRRISLSIKQAAEGGVVSAEYQEHFGEHAYDNEGNYIGQEWAEDPAVEEAWASYEAEQGFATGEAPVPTEEPPVVVEGAEGEAAAEPTEAEPAAEEPAVAEPVAEAEPETGTDEA